MLEIGDKMPAFSAPDQNGKLWSSEDLAGKKAVIYFYPKANTPGCTAEACDIRDNYERFMAQGYTVIGISKDSVAAQGRFSEKYSLPFPLLSDPETKILQAFGAWGEKKNYGKVTMGTIRSTFVFDEEGTVVRVFKKVDTKNHSAQILG